jgi:hypothetical protein
VPSSVRPARAFQERTLLVVVPVFCSPGSGYLSSEEIETGA